LTIPPRALYLAMLLGGTCLPMTAPLALAATTEATPTSPSAPVALMLAQNWQPDLLPSEFLVSEKLDGVRAYWDGQTLRFRSGRLIAAPAWFTAALPPVALDGELWMGRRSFDRLSGTVRKSVPVDAQWRAVRYMIFDMPAASGNFSQRATQIEAMLAQASVPWLQSVEQSRVVDHAALQQLLLKTESAGGEGLVLHRADALWQLGRNEAVRKLKLQPDEEARVLASLPGTGRHAGRMGALLLELADGQHLKLGTGFTDAQRANPPSVGTLVTYRYRGRTPSGLPKFASFLRVREIE
jgi:DNA ligase-1